MTVVLDHVILFCSEGAPEAEALVRIGLTEGSRNTHPGQGTANRRFFFSNAYLELLWVRDAIELEATPLRHLGFRERGSGRLTDVCPFGLALRPAGSGETQAPFPSWPYRPAYLPPGLAIDVAEDVPVTEPLSFHLGFAHARPASLNEPTTHSLGVNRITHILIHAPLSGPHSRAANLAEHCGILSLQRADQSLMTITFDGGARCASADLRPALPLVLQW